MADDNKQTATFFRNVSDFLQRDGRRIEFAFLNTLRPTEGDLKHWAKAQSDEKSTQALWLYLLLRLTLLSTDSRLEVRHSKYRKKKCRTLSIDNRELQVPCIHYSGSSTLAMINCQPQQYRYVSTSS